MFLTWLRRFFRVRELTASEKCARAGHPGARVTSSPMLGVTEFWCQACGVWFLEDDR